MKIKTLLHLFSSIPIRSSSPLVPKNPVQRIVEELSSIKDLEASVRAPSTCASVRRCLALMDSLALADLGLSHASLARLPHIGYAEIFASHSFLVCLFVLPAGRALPLHDHPDMTVLSKIVSGSLQVRSFSKDETYGGLRNENIAKGGVDTGSRVVVNLESNETKSETDKAWFLTPSEGNFHEFESVAPCCVFDVLMPPYLPPRRECNYYSIASLAGARGKEGGGKEGVGEGGGSAKKQFLLTRNNGIGEEIEMQSMIYKGLKPY